MSKAALKQSPELFDDRDPINEAIVVYTGYGKSSFPRARSGDLVTQFGDGRASELKSRILALYDELAQPVPEQEKRSKKSVTERAIEALHPAHPELDETGLKALAWAFSFGLR